ncbi:hypothetical protein EC2864350_4494 [Escherichia coli 2864350]|nr:hypothetical protein EC2780750_4569 [Escherichia coli 2780750]EMX56847.1 hypothetical protein ECMP0209802_0107 [Escherichia coli MP020980.2]ENA90137.1 hypothetical protein EC2864350_4494 [Escherichia coli 2864350]END49190.1 hypothetical protein ECMP0209801_4956 [Escherichia coli MP020980.1]
MRACTDTVENGETLLILICAICSSGIGYIKRNNLSYDFVQPRQMKV